MHFFGSLLLTSLTVAHIQHSFGPLVLASLTMAHIHTPLYRPNMISHLPSKPIQPLGDWVWGSWLNGFVYRAPQTFGGGKVPSWSVPGAISGGKPKPTNADPGHQYEHPENVHFEGWSYTGANGSASPQNWGEINKYCLGNSQSPINLDTSTAVRNGQNGNLVFEKYDLVNKKDTLLENNGHSVELELTSVPAGAAMMSGGPLTKSYQLLQLHFHWGSTDQRGSEHTIDNQRFPLEMHLVHLASDIEWGVGSATSPRNVPDGLAVAAFLWEVGPDDNPALEPIIEKMKEVRERGTEGELENDDFNVGALISPVISGAYFSYHGSLTTPNCNEVVHWINFKNTLSLSARQLAEFRLLHNTVGEPLMDNYRPTQPTNNRIVTLVDSP